MAEGIENSKLVILSESNHYPFLEEKELFFMEVKQFTKKTLV